MLHVGLDMHKQFSELAVLDDNRSVVEQKRLYHQNRHGIEQYFVGLDKPAVVTLGATRNRYWLFELLEAEGRAVKLAHPLKVRLIAEARIKTDPAGR